MNTDAKLNRAECARAKIRRRKAANTLARALLGATVAGPAGAIAGAVAARLTDAGDRLRSGANRSKAGTQTEAVAKRSPEKARRSVETWANPQPKRILVPLDSSEPSKRAAAFARELARGAKAGLEEIARKEFADPANVSIILRRGMAHEQL